MATLFNSDGPFVATRNLLINGQPYQAGDEVSVTGLSIHRLKQLVSNRQLRVMVTAKIDVEAPETLFKATSPSEPLIEERPLSASPMKRLRAQKDA